MGVLHSIDIADPLLGNQGGGPVVINSDTPLRVPMVASWHPPGGGRQCCDPH